MEQETREIRVPLAVHVGEREIAIPVTVPVPYEAVVALVQRHLDGGEELHGMLLEYYADHVSPGAAPDTAAKNGAGTRRRTPRRTEPPAAPLAETDADTESTGVEAPAPPRTRRRRRDEFTG